MEHSKNRGIVLNTFEKSKLCTDIPCFFVFVLFWICLLVIIVLAMINGNYLALINGYDTYGNICGLKHNKHFPGFPLSGTDTYSKPYLLYFNSIVIDDKECIRICAEECIEEALYSDEDLFHLWNQTKSQYCRYDFPMELLNKFHDQLSYTDRLGPCPAIVYLISEPLKHRCVAIYHNTEQNFETVKNIYSALKVGTGLAQLCFLNVYLAWPKMLALAVIALVSSIILLIMIHWASRVILWIVGILAIISNAVLCAILWETFNQTIDADDGFYKNVDDPIYYNLLEEHRLNDKAVHVLAIISSIVIVLLILFVILFGREFSKVAVVFEETATFLTKLPELSIIPLIGLVVLVSFLLCWSYVGLCLTTATYSEIYQHRYTGEKTAWGWNLDVEHQTYQGLKYVGAESIQGLVWIYIVGFIWTTEFIFACEEFTLSAAIVHWYFKRPTKSPIIHAIGILMKYHLGTVAMGSLFTILFKIPKLILTCLCKIFRKDEGVRYLFLSGCNNRIKLLERWVQSLNHNVYPIVAKESINFIPAGRRLWSTMVTIADAGKDIHTTMSAVLFLAKFCVATLTCVIAIYLLRGAKEWYFYMAPVILSALFAFYIANSVILLFQVTLDTVFLCICEDSQLYGNDGQWTESKLAMFISRSKMTTQQQSIHIINVRSMNNGNFKPNTFISSPSL